MKESKLIGNPVFSGVSTTESISLSEVKQHLFIDSSNTVFDNDLTRLITEVREWAEGITALSLIEKTVEVIIDYECGFKIPFGPVTSFTSAAKKTGVAEYETETVDEDFEIEAGRFISYTGAWRYKLIYDAGYTSSTIPEGLKLALKNEIAKRFNKRGDDGVANDNNVLLEPYKMLEWTI